MAGYTRQRTIADGNTIAADLFNGEYNQIVNAFNVNSGHKHDGTAAEGPVIGLIGDAGLSTPLNKIVVDTSNGKQCKTAPGLSLLREQYNAALMSGDNTVKLCLSCEIVKPERSKHCSVS